MNSNNYVELVNQIEELISSLNTVKKDVNALKINDKFRLNSNIPIGPGVACKIAFDHNGLIVKGSNLESTDIPQLDISKIDGLKKSLDNKASAKEFNILRDSLKNIIEPLSRNKDNIIGTATKVNFTSDGRIVSSSELLPSDIPELSIEKITGLQDILDGIKSHVTSKNIEESNFDVKTTPGVYTKVKVDNLGRVVYGDKLSMDDIPIEFITRLNEIDSKLLDTISKDNIDKLFKILDKKLDAKPIITPGVYTKVIIDENGLVTKGDNLSIEDLPELHTSDINGLDHILNDKASHSDIIELNNTMAKMLSSFNKIGDITSIKNSLSSKAADSEVKDIASKVKSIENSVNNIIDHMPSDMLANQLQQIQNELSSLDSRLLIIEKQLKI